MTSRPHPARIRHTQPPPWSWAPPRDYLAGVDQDLVAPGERLDDELLPRERVQNPCRLPRKAEVVVGESHDVPAGKPGLLRHRIGGRGGFRVARLAVVIGGGYWAAGRGRLLCPSRWIAW